MAEEEGLDCEYHKKSEEDDQDPNAVVDEDTFVACMVDYFDDDCHDCLCTTCEGDEFEASCPLAVFVVL